MRLVPRPLRVRSSEAKAALQTAYMRLSTGRPDLATKPLATLAATRRHRDEVATGRFWASLLEDKIGEARLHLAAVTHPTEVHRHAIEVAESGSVDYDAVEALAGGAAHTEPVFVVAPILVLAERHGALREVCDRVGQVGPERLAQLERLTLDFGLVAEQVVVTSSLGRLDQTRA